MPTTSSYQHVFRVSKSEINGNASGGQTQASKPRRNRQPLSCEACRVRKLKCDRQSPCAPCIKRGGLASSPWCIYSKADKDSGHSPPSSSSATSSKSEAQLRLQKLEEMVTGLVQANSSSSASDRSSNPGTVDQRLKEVNLSPSNPEERPGSIPNGHLDTNGSEGNYHGATHWTTVVLENIQDIRGLLVDPAPEAPEEHTLPGLLEAPDIALATTQVLSIDDFLEALPPRVTVDNLVSTYLTSDGIRAPHVHSRKFFREYRTFWNDPHSTSLLWISMLFSVLWTSSYLGPAISDPTGKPFNHIALYTKAGQALVAGNYHKTRPYSADATLLYALCSFYVSKTEGDTDCWMMMGIATRLAVKMGYHRDPKHFPNISPFDGEMRRRCFFLLEAFDVLLSNQTGLPAILQEEDCDTELPRNLLDEDFDEDSGVLPASRPNSQATSMLYFCYKSRFAKAHKRAIRHALAIENISYAATLKLDAELHANDADVPSSLQMTGSLDDLLLDQPWQTIRRMHIKFQYLRSLCVLHRKYLNQGRVNPQYAYSRKICTDASLQLLKYQADMYLASLPGGRYHKNRAMLVMLSQHHFLLAAMIICLDMYECHNQQTLTSPEDLKAQATKYDTLKMSHIVWISRSKFSRDADQASTVVANMLSRVPRPDVPVTGADASSRMVSEPFNAPSNDQRLSNPTRFGVTDSTTIMSNQELVWNQPPALEDLPIQSFDAADPINMIFDGTENIDWDVIDQYLLDGSGGLDTSLDWQAPGSYRPLDLA